MKLRSLLFVPGDRPERFPKAAASGADAIIVDLEDAVSLRRKPVARAAVGAWLAGPRPVVTFVRVNPLDGDLVAADLAAILPCKPDGIVLPKCEGAASVEALLALAGGALPPILPIATETPNAVFQLGSYGSVADRLAGLTWGADDLPAAIGAAASREADGRYTPPYEVVRSLALFGAHAAAVPAIEAIFPRFDQPAEIASYVARARRDGFTGMLAIHPGQIEAINRGFSPGDGEIEQARAIVAAFAASPDSGALQLDGRMIDRPHLVQARRILAAAS